VLTAGASDDELTALREQIRADAFERPLVGQPEAR
jgi:hypothetical protein